MVLVLSVLLAVGVILMVGCAAAVIETSTQIIKHDVSPQEASALIQNNQNSPDFVILDVRTSAAFADGHIANAVNIDFYSATFRNDINQLDKSQTYLVYCRSGARSLSSAKIMEELSFSKVYNMLGGIIGWRAAGLPLVK